MTTDPPPPLGQPIVALHLVAAQLRPDAPTDAVALAVERARALASVPGVRSVLVGRSEAQLVVATWLDDRAALDAFAASQPHMRFVMQGLAPVIQGMWSAAVETGTPPPEATPHALWAFAVPATDSVYEWQVREVLQQIDASPGVAATGSTFEERERFRAAGIVLLDDAATLAAFASRLAQARDAWAETLGPLQEALVPALPA